MKILHVCEGLNPSTIVAQPWKHVYEISSRMIGRGHEVTILTNRSRVFNDNDIKGVPIHLIQKGEFLFNCEQLKNILNNKSIDVINFHGSDPWSAVHLWRLRNKLKADVVWTLHSGPVSFDDLKNLKLYEVFQLYKFWNNILNALCPSFILRKWANISQLKLILTLSKRLKEHLQHIGFNEDKIEIIRSGVDTEKFQPFTKSSMMLEKRNKGFREDDPIILYFGPLSRFRGADTIISAMPKIVRRIPSARLLLLARGFSRNSEERKLEKLVKERKEIVLIPGLLNEKMLIQYLAIADFVVLPFRFWPQVECPLTLLEAMSMEKPVITTNVGAIPEIVNDGENGILINPGYPEVMADTIVNLLQNIDLTNKISRNARAYVQSFHDWDVIVQQSLDTYKIIKQ
ncbi:MAG: glycosyltransferase family 4 protein [Candidatus Hodarchaeales archaeon]